MTTLSRASFDIFAGRLLILATHLENLPPEKFDFTCFVGGNWKGHQDLSCGATACGLGHAAVLFGEECGVELVYRSDWELAVPAVKGTTLRDMSETTAEAALKMFNIDNEDDFDRLFIPWGQGGGNNEYYEDDPPETRLRDGATAKDLGAHIRTFVKERYQEAPAL